MVMGKESKIGKLKIYLNYEEHSWCQEPCYVFTYTRLNFTPMGKYYYSHFTNEQKLSLERSLHRVGHVDSKSESQDSNQLWCPISLHVLLSSRSALTIVVTNVPGTIPRTSNIYPEVLIHLYLTTTDLMTCSSLWRVLGTTERINKKGRKKRSG